MHYSDCLEYVTDARAKGLKAPVILMGEFPEEGRGTRLIRKSGYYNPLIAYGEDKAVEDARKAGANGFIMVDLPPEEAIDFRNTCTAHGSVLSYSPYIELTSRLGCPLSL